MRRGFQQAIQIANGFGPIKFGSTLADVESVLGPPDEEELFDETQMAADWCYKLLRVHVGFYDVCGKGLRVISFLTGNQSATLWGTRLVGLQKSEILRLFRDHDHVDFTNAFLGLAAQSYETLRLDKSQIALDFRNGTLKTILWGAVSANTPA